MMRRILYEIFDHLGLPYTLNEPLTEKDKAVLPLWSDAYATVRVGTSRIIIGEADNGEDEIVGILNDDGSFIEGNEPVN